MRESNAAPWGSHAGYCGHSQSLVRSLIWAKYKWNACHGWIDSPESFSKILIDEGVGVDEVLLEVLHDRLRQLSEESAAARRQASFRAYGVTARGASWFDYMRAFPYSYELYFREFYDFFWGIKNVPAPHFGGYSLDNIGSSGPWVSYLDGGAIIWIGEPGNPLGSYGEMLHELHLLDSVAPGDTLLVLDGPTLGSAVLATCESISRDTFKIAQRPVMNSAGINRMFIVNSGATIRTLLYGPRRLIAQHGHIHVDHPGLLGKLSVAARTGASQVMSRSVANYSGLLRPWPTSWNAAAANWEDKCRWSGIMADEIDRASIITPGETISIQGGGLDFSISL